MRNYNVMLTKGRGRTLETKRIVVPVSDGTDAHAAVRAAMVAHEGWALMGYAPAEPVIKCLACNQIARVREPLCDECMETVYYGGDNAYRVVLRIAEIVKRG